HITPTPTPGPATATPGPPLTPGASGTPPPLPPTATLGGEEGCSIAVVRGFGLVYHDHPALRSTLDCPTAPEAAIGQAVEENFERGYMFWHGDTQRIYIFASADSTWQAYNDTYVEGSPPAQVLTPPP